MLYPYASPRPNCLRETIASLHHESIDFALRSGLSDNSDISLKLCSAACDGYQDLDV